MSTGMNHILLVEDEKMHAELIFRSFETYSDRFSLMHVRDISEAALEIQRVRPNLIIADYRLPDGIGTDLITREMNGSINPVVIMTSFGDEQLAVEALKSGALDYIVKSEHTLTDIPHIAARALRELQLRKDRARTRKALRKSEKKYRDLFDGAPLMYVITRNENGIPIIRDVNELFLNTLGYRSEQVVEKPLSDFYTPQSRSQLLEGGGYEVALRGPLVTSERNLLAKDGSIIDTLLNTVPDLDEAGHVIGTRAMYINTSALKKVQREKEVLESQLRQAQKMEAIGTLAGGIAHDFNNILSAVIGYSELSLVDTSTESPVYRNLQKVLQAGNRAKDLVSRILDFSRQTEVEPRPVQAKQIAMEALKLLRATLPATVEIRQRFDTDLHIMADPTQLHQVIMNLCTNAVHAMDYDGVLEIVIEQVDLQESFTVRHPDLSPGRYLKLSICDTGCGIVPGIMDRIFDPFFTTKEKNVGTGMGLSMVHGIVKTHGGAITVDSKIDTGTTFDAYIPAILDDPTPASEPEAPLHVGTERILFIDDEDLQVDLGKHMLTYLGYTVTGCTDSLEGLELFRQRPDDFDLVITDMTMPHITGDLLAGKLQEIRPDIPIIICTGYSEKLNGEKLKALGIKEFTMKPVVMKDLARLIRQVLDPAE